MVQSAANSVVLALKCVRSCVSEIFILSVILSIASIEQCIMYYLSVTLVPFNSLHWTVYHVLFVCYSCTCACETFWLLFCWTGSQKMGGKKLKMQHNGRVCVVCVCSRWGREPVVCCYSSCKKDGYVFDWLQGLPDWFSWTTFTNIQMSRWFKKCLVQDFWQFCWRVKNAISFSLTFSPTNFWSCPCSVCFQASFQKALASSPDDKGKKLTVTCQLSWYSYTGTQRGEVFND